MKRPILIIVLGFITGIIMGLYLNIAPFLFFCFILLVLIFKNTRFKRNNFVRVIDIFIKNNVILIFLISSLLSSIYLIYCNGKYQYFYDNFNKNQIVATVISNNKETEYKDTYKIKLEEYRGINLILRIQKSRKIELHYGDKIKINGKYIVADQARNFGGFNYKEYLKSQKVYGIYEAEKVEIISKKNLSYIDLFTNNIKIKIIENFNKILSEETRDLFLGILIGYDENLPEEIVIAFRKSSLTHLLAVSGAHIAYIIVGLSFLFFNANIPKRISYILTITTLIFFMYITDFSASVVRASIMGIIMLISVILHRKNDIKINMCLSIFLILIENPYKILDIGLLLSYLATIGIICFSRLRKNNKEELDFKGRIIGFIKELVQITIFANIFVIPIMLYNFNTVSLTFIISNIIAGVLIGPITIGGFILIIVSFITTKIAYIIAIPYNLLLKLLIQSTNLISLIPESEILVITPNISLIIIFYLILFIYIFFLFMKKEYYNRFLIRKICGFFKKCFDVLAKNIKVIFFLSVIFITIITLIIKIIPNDLKIYFIDVGQGDSTLIVTPTNKKILIDSGGSETGNFDIGKNTLLPYLLDRKINSLDYICISHFDSDHCQGFSYLLNNIKVKNIIFSKQYETTRNFEEIINIAMKKNINLIKVEAGNILKIDKFVRIKVFNPGKILTNDINDNSIVMKLEYNSFSCLFTGDISKIIENDLVKKYGKELQSDLLKVAHHGSKTSSDESFIKIVKPQIALIGVGVNNKFGHPNNEILESLIDIKCNIYRTDKDGEINLRVDNRR